MAMSYGHVYVARSPSGPRWRRPCRPSRRRRPIPGPSLIIAYSHCIAHGYDMALGAEQQKLAVSSGVWPLYRYDPARVVERRAAAPPRLAAPQGQRRRLHAQRGALPHGRAAPTPQRFKQLRRGGARPRPGTATPSTSSSPGITRAPGFETPETAGPSLAAESAG